MILQSKTFEFVGVLLTEQAGAMLWRDQESELAKGATHKYIKRVPIPGKPGRYRYYYHAAHGGTVGHGEHLVVGAAFKVDGGHAHITEVKGGKVTIRHDETGEVETVSKAELTKRLTAHHRESLEDKHRERLRALDAAAKHGAKGKAVDRLHASTKALAKVLGEKAPAKPKAPKAPAKPRAARSAAPAPAEPEAAPAPAPAHEPEPERTPEPAPQSEYHEKLEEITSELGTTQDPGVVKRVIGKLMAMLGHIAVIRYDPDASMRKIDEYLRNGYSLAADAADKRIVLPRETLDELRGNLNRSFHKAFDGEWHGFDPEKALEFREEDSTNQRRKRDEIAKDVEYISNNAGLLTLGDKIKLRALRHPTPQDDSEMAAYHREARDLRKKVEKSARYAGGRGRRY